MASLAEKLAAMQKAEQKKNQPPTTVERPEAKEQPEKRPAAGRPRKTKAEASGKRGRNFMLLHYTCDLLDTIHSRTRKPMGVIIDEAIEEYAKKHGFV